MNFLRDVCSLHRNLSTTFHGVLLAIILKESVYFFVYLLDMTDSTVLYIYIYVHREKSLGLMNCKRLPTSSENVRSDTLLLLQTVTGKK